MNADQFITTNLLANIAFGVMIIAITLLYIAHRISQPKQKQNSKQNFQKNLS